MANWRYTLNIKLFLNTDRDAWEEARDNIVSLLKTSRDYEHDIELQSIVDEMTDADDLDWFNAILDRLYDWADFNLVWLGLY